MTMRMTLRRVTAGPGSALAVCKMFSQADEEEGFEVGENLERGCT